LAPAVCRRSGIVPAAFVRSPSFAIGMLAGSISIHLEEKIVMQRTLSLGAAAGIASGALMLSPTTALASCGSAFCTVNSDWTSESAIVAPGSTLDLRYEYINQDKPRTGTRNISVGEIPAHHDEVSTANRNWLLSYSYTLDSNWGVSVVAPLVSRNHFPLPNHGGEPISERWSFDEIGDVRVVGRYQVPAGDPLKPITYGINFGVKLPTGRTHIANGHGDVAERSLQPGTGTTDAIVGAYFHQRLPQTNGAWFAQATYQQALNTHDEFKPGSRFNFDVGYRHGFTDEFGALIQLNASIKRRDKGAEAEPEDSGGRFVFISPGLSYAITPSIQVYGFVQLPIHQYVNGVQLTARRAYVAGVSGRF
jgi:hypothetical protein